MQEGVISSLCPIPGMGVRMSQEGKDEIYGSSGGRHGGGEGYR